MAGGKTTQRGTAVRRLRQLAQAPVNDAVKLAFLESGEGVDQLDLTALAEFRRSDKGAVEIKLVDRAAIWKDLALMGEGSVEERAEEFFRALEREGGK